MLVCLSILLNKKNKRLIKITKFFTQFLLYYLLLVFNFKTQNKVYFSIILKNKS